MAKKLFEVLIVVSSVLDCLRFYLLSPGENVISPAVVNISRGNVAPGLQEAADNRFDDIVFWDKGLSKKKV